MKTFLYQSALFVLVVILIQFFIGSRCLSYPEFCTLNTYLQKKYQVIYLGDSVIDSIGTGDTDRRTIAEMLRDHVPEKTIADFSHSSYHPRIFEDIVDYISRQPQKPEAVIIPINMGTFSPGWNKPMYQFEKEKFYYRVEPSFLNAFFKPLAVFNAINVNTVTEEDYVSAPVYYHEDKVGIVSDFDNPKNYSVESFENIRNDYIFRYMYALKESHKNLLALRRTLSASHTAGIKVYLYITPIDTEGGKKYVGNDFISQIKDNTDMVCAVAREAGDPCLNLAFGLPHDAFFFGSFPNEHLKQEGRAFVAKKVAEFFFGKSVEK